MKYTPEQVRKALSIKRMGGPCYCNLCADGETFLTKNIDQYVKVLLEEGHYVEFVTNLTIIKILDIFLSWDKEFLKHLEFKHSFHYLELKRKNLLVELSRNVQSENTQNLR